MVRFDKNKSNDQRNSRVAEGKAALESASGIKASAWAAMTAAEAAEQTDLVVEGLLETHPVGMPFDWPFHTRSEPGREIRTLTGRPSMPNDRSARLMRLATLRSVDYYSPRGEIKPSLRRTTWAHAKRQRSDLGAPLPT
ncbi:hypothetical protein [Phaeobacter inhibens]|uniref:hypothetical protein n=1 Tax=Phaeobacter inhibens TaxID=221822 RepID=UPI000486C5ED|nr:hypothetical protein [Phaeobacter inhibens]MDO6755087.1 hypothetical protein [Phaeobacter inhibens]